MQVLGSWLINLQKIDHGLSVVPTKEWQDNLSRCLASRSTPSSCTPDSDDGHVSQRRRLNGYCKVPADWDSLLTIDNPDGTHKIDSFTLPLTRLILRGIREKYDGRFVPSIIKREFRGK